MYSTLSVAIWWFFLTATLFWKIWFPFHARRIETAHKLHYIHITCVIIGVLVPFIPIISLMSAFSVMLDSQDPPKPTFWKGGLGFASARFPPLPCNGNDKNVLFYSDILPSDIILASGITLIILIFWLVHKVGVSYFQSTNNDFYLLCSNMVCSRQTSIRILSKLAVLSASYF